MVIDLRPIILVNGVLLTLLGLAMLLPALADVAAGNNDWVVFATTSAITIFAGIGMTLTNWGYGGGLSVQQAFILTTSIWILSTAFAALPFVFTSEGVSYTDAFFEAMSGLTTTGSTVLTGLDSAPPGILLWRALLQWLGGIGIIVMAIAILPMLQVGGMQLFRLESSEKSEKVLPRAVQIVGSIAIVYVTFSVLCAICYNIAGMSGFDAIAHSMTTVATGGFSTSDLSLGKWNNPFIDLTAVIFMILGSLPFLLYWQAMRGDAEPLLRDSQVRWFFTFAGSFIAILTIFLMLTDTREGWQALRYAMFNAVSVMTGTGYATTAYDQWGSFAVVLFFCMMFVGGCAGSTSCGIKIFRFQIVFATVVAQVKRMIHPNGVFLAKYNNRPIMDDVASSVLSFFFMFLVCFSVLAFALSVIGLDPLTALSAAGTAVANVGPGLGEVIGPAGTFAPLPDLAKWLLCFGMLLGRLELFTVLVLFTPGFWRG